MAYTLKILIRIMHLCKHTSSSSCKVGDKAVVCACAIEDWSASLSSILANSLSCKYKHYFVILTLVKLIQIRILVWNQTSQIMAIISFTIYNFSRLIMLLVCPFVCNKAWIYFGVILFINALYISASRHHFYCAMWVWCY